VRRQKALMGSFVIDLCAMTFGMPRALFPVLSLTVFHAGAAGTGFLNAAVAFGSVVAALTTGWLTRARYLGRIVMACVAVWGAGVALAGLMTSIYLAIELEEVSHLGGGVVFAVVIQDARLIGGDGHLRQREGWVYLYVGGLIARLTTSDVDQARAAAERLAQERG
jgi:MFS family permease